MREFCNQEWTVEAPVSSENFWTRFENTKPQKLEPEAKEKSEKRQILCLFCANIKWTEMESCNFFAAAL